MCLRLGVGRSEFILEFVPLSLGRASGALRVGHLLLCLAQVSLDRLHLPLQVLQTRGKVITSSLSLASIQLGVLQLALQVITVQASLQFAWPTCYCDRCSRAVYRYKMYVYDIVYNVTGSLGPLTTTNAVPLQNSMAFTCTLANNFSQL